MFTSGQRKATETLREEFTEVFQVQKLPWNVLEAVSLSDMGNKLLKATVSCTAV